MNILRLSSLSLTFAIAVFALGYANPSFAGKPDCENNSTHPKCKNDEPTDGAVTYKIALEGAFVFTSLDADTNPHGNELKPDAGVTFRYADSTEKATWDNVFSLPDPGPCNLFDSSMGAIDPLVVLQNPKKNKGWGASLPGGVRVHVGFPLATFLGADVNVGLQLIGNCAYSGGTDETCDPFLPVPTENYGDGPGISKIPLQVFWIHADAVKGTPQIEGCHMAHTDLLVPSTLVITATAVP